MHILSSPAARSNTRREGKARKKPSLLKRMSRAILSLIVLLAAVWALIGYIGEQWMDQKKLAAFAQPSAQTYIPTNEMPDYVWQAFIAIEDHRFPYHPGVDPIAIGRSIWVDLSTDSKAQGASTITMQLARNLFLSHDKTMERKLKETAIAIRLEQEYSKQELLTMYLNTIYFGHGTYGIEKAADFYFGKTVRENGQKHTITLSEAALLASLPKAPESYSPVKHLEKAKQRQALVLKRMADLGFITEAEKEDALKKAIVLQPSTRAYVNAS